MTKPLSAATATYSKHVAPPARSRDSTAGPLPKFALTASRVSATVVIGMVRAFEVLVIAGLGCACAHFYVDGLTPASDLHYPAALALVGFGTLSIFEMLGLYSIPAFLSVLRQMPRILLGWMMAFGLLVAAAFFFKIGDDFSRVWLALWFGCGFVALIGERLALAGLIRHWTNEGRLCRRAAIYGGGSVTAELIAQLEADVDSDVRICGIFDDRKDDRVPSSIAGYPRLGGLADLVAVGRRVPLDVIVVALPVAAEARLIELMKQLALLPADVRVPAIASRLRFSRRTYSRLGSVAMIDLHDKPISDWGLVVKAAFDRVVALLALVALSPLMLAAAAAIKLDSKGPVLFRQRRYGFNNELIGVFKFRSMYVDSADMAAAKLVTKNDPRVTKVGRILRKTSIDELPQLFNVLKGELSLVGPRPHALQAKAADRLYDEVVAGYFARHKVKPGITGWAQVSGWRGETDTPEKIEKRVEHDLYYIDNWSVLFDIYILLKTPFALIKTDNAY